jgi:hypothetical protein
MLEDHQEAEQNIDGFGLGDGMAARWCLRGGSRNMNVFFGLFVWCFLVRLCQKKI